MTSVLIIGAGPVGLVAAIECARRGIDVTIIDRTSGPTDESRAVGLSRQSLRLLEPSGASAKILDQSVALRRARFHDKDKHLTTLDVPQPEDDSPPPMVLLSQSETERILIDTLQEYGVTPLWNREAKSMQQNPERATAIFADGARLSADYMLGADGSRSYTRKSLGFWFHGETYEESWSLLDAEIDWPYIDVQAAPFLNTDGSVMFAVQIADGLYRVISNREDVETDVARQFVIKRVHWKSEFNVSLRAVENYGDRRIWIAGDAAHVHSPVGGMGMNLGIEDACDFAATVEGNKDFQGYEAVSYTHLTLPTKA